MKISAALIHKIAFVSLFITAFAGVVCAQDVQPKPIPKQISGGILNGKATSLPKPEYPAAARAENASGQVGVQVLIDEDGNVVSAKATSGPANAALRSAAESAALQAKFSPTLLSGNPVKVSGVITYNFVANEGLDDGMDAFMAATVLFLFKDLAADPELFSKALEMDNGDLRSVLKEAASDPEFPGLEELAKLESTPAAKRVELLESVINAMSANLKAERSIWKFELGRGFSDVLSPMMREFISDGDPANMDEVRVKKGLKVMKQMLANSPNDIPVDVLAKLNSLAAFADRDDLLAEQSLAEFAARVESVFDSVSPN